MISYLSTQLFLKWYAYHISYIYYNIYMHVHVCITLYIKYCDIISYTYAYIYNIYTHTHTHTHTRNICFLSVSLFLLFFFLLSIFYLYLLACYKERTVNELLTLVFRKNQSLPRATGTYHIIYTSYYIYI